MLCKSEKSPSNQRLNGVNSNNTFTILMYNYLMQRGIQRMMLIFISKIMKQSYLLIVSILLLTSVSFAQQNDVSQVFEGQSFKGQGLEGIVSTAFFMNTFSSTDNLSVGLIHLQPEQSSYVFDGEAKVGIVNITNDDWGYAEKGFEISLNSKSNPYSVNETSTDFLLSTKFFQSLDSLIGATPFGLSGFTEFSLEGRINSNFAATAMESSPVSALGTVGYRQSFDTNLSIANSIFTIDRISVEPKVRAWIDSDIAFGADVAIRADTSIFDSSNLSLGLEGGYTDGFWYNFTINSPIKF